jgi:hypothetical protein
MPGAFYRTIEKPIGPPFSLDNRNYLLGQKLQNPTVPTCSVIVLSTIYEALYWQKTGKRIEIDTVKAFELANKDKNINNKSVFGTNIDSVIAAINSITPPDFNLKLKRFVSAREYKFLDADKLATVIKSLVHKYLFCCIGELVPGTNTNHMRLCVGYSNLTAIIQESYKALSSRFLYVPFVELAKTVNSVAAVQLD